MREVTDRFADQFELSDEECKVIIPSGTQALFDNCVGWARTYLVKAGLLETPKRWENNVAPAEIQKFVGALHGKKENKVYRKANESRMNT